ncbi:glycerate kinase [Carboxydothermus ferrireducens]|uniref:Glycerate kinase n=1 Tax=Carboxydothermus ferrireducens DSM 11255 TaxID=1119529 RepID=A0ABX2RA85_9THEO|nr:glycerate kinase [Carboxydothermus ferrireducens]NYE58079.1 glycerate kinase [Carboxydothermus ferrireducens DSM 11255]
MKIVVAPDSFKGSLSSLKVALAIERGIKRAASEIDAEIEIIKIPMADGGEGTVEAIMCALGGRLVKTRVLDPLGREIDSFFGVLPDGTAVIEMAAASGLNLLKTEEKNPMITTTYGTGQLIRAALDEGCRKLIIGIGGSATNDGGVGMAQALGVKFLDSNDREIGFGGGELYKIERIDYSGLDARIKDTDIVVACDVKNVLCGPTGASAVYGPQKGATLEMVKVLDENLRHLATMIKRYLGKDVAEVPGSGAAGGLGAALLAFLDAKLRPGIEIVMELAQFPEVVKTAELIITGEGATDYQTMFGKVPLGVARVARKFGKPVVCISGSLNTGYEKLYAEGITALFSIVNRPMTLDEAMERAEELLEKISENVFRLYYLMREGDK